MDESESFELTPFYQDERATIYHGDCIEVMRSLPDNSVDSIVTDPPYELGFMGKSWDNSGIAYSIDLWREALRILKPGGHLLAFGGTRTWHRLTVAIEDAGFEVRDSIAWMYGSGFPKSLDVSKAIDKAAGAEREVVGQNPNIERAARSLGGEIGFGAGSLNCDITAPATPAAQQWSGFGTALKPAFEPVVVARKPLIGTVANNVLTHGTGALNIDGCRIGTEGEVLSAPRSDPANRKGLVGKALQATGDVERNAAAQAASIARTNTLGRWPANVILDESQAAELDKQSDTGGASRFFYCAKAGKKERPNVNGVAHPTVKPLRLMEYLCRLVTPPGGTVLEPFSGSGTTIEAALGEGFTVIGIEMTEEYLPLITARTKRHGEKLC